MGKTMATFSQLFFIGSFSYLEVMITYIRTWITLKFGQIGLCLKKVSPLFSAVHPFLFILAGNDDMHQSSDEFEFRPEWTTDCGVSCP